MSAGTRTSLAKLIGGIAVAMALIGSAEGLLRWLLGPPPPPVVVFSGLEPHESYFSVEDGMVTAIYQSRDPLPPWSAVVDHPRIAVIGGSSVHERSAGVLPQQQFPALIEDATGIDTLNLGSPALDSHDLVRLVEELLEFQLDTLIVYTGHNDFGNTYFNQRYGSIRAGLSARTQAGMEQLQLFCQLRRMLTPITQTTTAGPNTIPGQAPIISRTQWWAALRYLESNLRRIVWMSQKADVSVLLVTPVSSLASPPASRLCPEEGPCSSVLWGSARSLYSTDREAAEALMRKARDHDPIPMRAPSHAVDAVRRVAAEEGVRLIDAERDLPQHDTMATPAEELFYDHVHFTAAGHLAMANLLSSALQTPEN